MHRECTVGTHVSRSYLLTWQFSDSDMHYESWFILFFSTDQHDPKIIQTFCLLLNSVKKVNIVKTMRDVAKQWLEVFIYFKLICFLWRLRELAYAYCHTKKTLQYASTLQLPCVGEHIINEYKSWWFCAFPPLLFRHTLVQYKWLVQ